MRKFLFELLGVLYFFLFCQATWCPQTSATFQPPGPHSFFFPKNTNLPESGLCLLQVLSRANPKPKRTFYAAQHLNQPTNKTRGVSHYGLAIYMKKCINAKEELRKLKYFSMQKYNLQKYPLQETKILQNIITL
jgi:hypothetical protein